MSFYLLRAIGIVGFSFYLIQLNIRHLFGWYYKRLVDK